MGGDLKPRSTVAADIVFPDFESAEHVRLWLSERFASEADPLRILRITAEAIGRFLRVARVGYGELEPGVEFINVPLDWARPGMASMAGRHPFYADSALTGEYRRGRTLIVNDVSELDLVHKEARLLELSDSRAFVTIPLLNDGALVALFVAIDDKPRVWTPEEVQLLGQTGSRIWGALEHLRLTAKLRESEEQFRLLAESLPGLCWVGDEKGNLRWGNRQWHEMFEGTRGAQGDPIDLVHPDDVPQASALLAQMRARRTPDAVQLRMRGRDGSYRPYLTKVVPLHDSGGAVARWCAVQIDLSDKQALDRRQTVLRALHDVSRDLTDADRILAALSRILSEHLGITHFLYGEAADGDLARMGTFHAANGVSREDLAGHEQMRLAYEKLAARGADAVTQVISDNTQLGRAPGDPVQGAADLMGTRSGIIVPIVKEGRMVAVMAVLDSVPRQWTVDETDLCEELAERVWATVARARAETALQERERNQAFLIDWSDRIRSETSPGAILVTTLEWLGRHLGVTRTTYAETDATGRIFSVREEWRDGVASIKGNVFTLESVGASVDRAWVAGEVIRYEDVANDPRLEPPAKARYAGGEIGAFVSMPLVQDGTMHSALSVQHDRPRRWRDSEIQLMRDIAERTWVALERATAQAALQERERNQTFLLAWSDRIRNETNARGILGRTLAALGEHLGVERANFAEASEDGSVLCVVQEWREGVLSTVDQRYPLSALGKKLAAAHSSGLPVCVDDTATDPRFDETNKPLFDSLGIAAVLTLPMIRSGKIVAVLSVQQGTPRRWSDSEVELVRDVADRTLAVLQRAHSEERLAESEAQLAAFMENAPVAMHLKDGEGRYIRVNPEFAKALGKTPDQLRGKHPSEIFPPEIAAQLDTIERDARNGQVAGAEIALDGFIEVTHVLSMAFPIGASVGIAKTGGFTLDLTERKRAEAALAQSREALYQTEKLSALGSLLAGVSHELNNPLSIVVAQAVMMERQSQGSELAVRAQKIRRAADRCARIVQTFLAMARQKRPERAAVDLNAVAMAAHELADYGLKTDGIVSNCDFAPALPLIAADSDQLHQIIINLIVNAQQAMVDAGTDHRLLTLRTALGEAGMVTLDVCDTGPGIPDEVRRRIFEPFVTTKPQGQGTGVGLSFSQGLAEAHGGRLELTPSAEGACFRLTLPIDPDQTLPSIPSELAHTVAKPARRALVIDDEAEIAEALADFLSIEGFACDIAVGGADARAQLRAGDFDLIVSDIRMPEIDGPQLHAWMTVERPDLLSRVAFATGDTLGAAAARFLIDVQRPVLEKPFTPEAVSRFLQQMDLA
ncbi:MAG: GAF domain-containing protein [Sphingomonas sp.]